MTEWDDLWEDICVDLFDNDSYSQPVKQSWLKQVRAMGDINQTLAEKWFKSYKDIAERYRTIQMENVVRGQAKIRAEEKLESIRVLNEALYEALPSGKIDAFELIKLIGFHYEQVAEVLGNA